MQREYFHLSVGFVQALSKSKAVQVRSCAARPNTQPFHKGPPKLRLPSVALEGRGVCRPLHNSLGCRASATARDVGHCHLRPRQEESTKKQST